MSILSAAELRRMANRLFELMESAQTPPHASERHEAVVDELTARTKDSTERVSPVRHVRVMFRDAPLSHRFELICDGLLAACLIYEAQGSTVTLKTLVTKDGFDDQALQDRLLIQVIVHLHQRRLRVRSLCSQVDAFLLRNHRYQCLVYSSP